MTVGARIPIKYLRPSFRKNRFKKCVVCEKSLRPENKSSICSLHGGLEYQLNYRSQGLLK